LGRYAPGRNFAFTHLSLTAGLAQLGRIEEARAAANEPRAKFYHRPLPRRARSDNPRYLGGRERIYEGMRVAGIPEYLRASKAANGGSMAYVRFRRKAEDRFRGASFGFAPTAAIRT